MVTSTLAEYQVRILDIGQAVIHEELNLGMLVELPLADCIEDLARRLEEWAQGAELILRIAPIDLADYQEWVAQQGRERYIVTLLTNDVTAQQLALVTRALNRAGLTIDGIRRLSGRAAAGTAGIEETRTSVEFSLRGSMRDAQAVKAELLELGGDLSFDFSVQEDSVYRRNRRLVVFDMDSTLIKAEVIDELARLAGVGAKVSAITERAMAGELDFEESFHERVALLKGLSVTALNRVADSVQVMEGAHRLISSLRHFGYKTAIVSGGIRQIGEHLKDALGIDYLYANELEVKNGVITGEVKGTVIDAQGKVERLTEICRKEDISLQQAIAIGDGANDLPMLNAAGLGVAFHAKPAVKASASHAISNFGLDSVLYLMGFSDRDIEQTINSE